MSRNRHSRSPKLVGDFGEGLATYLLIRKGFQVAVVDHVGADLIAERDGKRYAISVKTRRLGKGETNAATFGPKHIEHLDHFANRFGMDAALMHIACIEPDQLIHAFMMKTADIKRKLKRVKLGYRLNFSKKHLDELVENEWLDYSVFREESIDPAKLF